MEVLKKNPEIFDKEGVLSRMDEMGELKSYISQLEGQIKNLSGDLQTAQRETMHAKQDNELSKFKSHLAEIEANANADRKVRASKLDAAVKLSETELAMLNKQEKGGS